MKSSRVIKNLVRLEKMFLNWPPAFLFLRQDRQESIRRSEVSAKRLKNSV